MPSQRDKLQQDARFRILRMLESNPQMSQRTLSRELGISLGAVNFCLNALIEKGHLKIKNFRVSNKKSGYAYVLTPKGVAAKAALTGQFLQRKMDEYDALKAEIVSLQEELELGADMGLVPDVRNRTRSRK
ncbi:MarR family EPS-associated transcriptional regulator [Marimonas sp. MJW-29]|uniref:MarR family EPS-associated transcriptional regulator n=1 Tax=Sulfitobacter sediminis TaxID=3234186 RepID=A0ABV3RN04_9RHOB